MARPLRATPVHNAVGIITPSRERPDRLFTMYEYIYRFSNRNHFIFVGLDDDDPKLDEYYKKFAQSHPTFFNINVAERNSLSHWTNKLADKALNTLYPEFLVSMGDDHVVRTLDWSEKLIWAIRGLSGPGFAFADDGCNGSGLCTSWMVHSKIVKALGWMMLPTCNHMYVDNAIMELGLATNRIAYVPDVVIEHMHPVIEKSEIDDTYRSSNNADVYEHDLKAYRRWRFGPQFEKDVQTILDIKW